MNRTVFLIGARASGKTTVGRLLADRLGVECVDTDDLFADTVGASIADYVAAHGWDAFRDREAEALALAAEPPAKVVACGGGMVLRPENREALARGLTVYLKADPAVLAARLCRDPLEAQRPSLTGKSPADEMAQILSEREPLYQSCAHLTLDATQPPDSLAAAIASHCR